LCPGIVLLVQFRGKLPVAAAASSLQRITPRGLADFPLEEAVPADGISHERVRLPEAHGLLKLGQRARGQQPTPFAGTMTGTRFLELSERFDRMGEWAKVGMTVLVIFALLVFLGLVGGVGWAFWPWLGR
jgi:hypothetical protein